MNVRNRVACAALVAAVAAGCGGGGYDDGVPASDSYDVAAAWRNLLGADADFTLAGVGSDNDNYTLALALRRATAAAYPLTGEVGARGIQTTTLLRNAVSLGTTTTTRFHDAGGRLIGTSSAAGECATVTAQAALPAAAAVGSSGVLFDATRYDSCQPGGAMALGTLLADWSLEVENGVVLFCVTSEQRDALDNRVAVESDCIAVDRNGALGPYARTSIAVPGGLTLVARNY